MQNHPALERRLGDSPTRGRRQIRIKNRSYSDDNRFSFLYSECSNAHIEKGICHVNIHIHLSQSYPKPSCTGHWVDYNFGYSNNNWFHLGADRPCYRTSRFKDAELALESLRFPIPSLG